MTNSIKIKHNLLKYIGCMLIAGLIAFGIASCSKDDEDPIPEKPKTEEEIQIELKEELRTTMKFNSNYKYLLYYTGFSSIKEFNSLSLTPMEMDNTTNTPYMAPFIVIDKKGVLWSSFAGSPLYYDKWTIKKVDNQFEISVSRKDLTMYFSDGPKKDPQNGPDMLIKYNPATGETFEIIEVYQADVLYQAVAYRWIQEKTITTPVVSPSADTPSLIDF